MSREHEELRKELWVRVYVACVQSSNSTSKYGAIRWADQALADFDSRFKEYTSNK